MAGKQTRIMYIECKSGKGHCGGARICRVAFSNSGRTLYFRGLVLQRRTWTLHHGNYLDINTGLEYWVSGPKRNGQDRHWAGGGPVRVEPDVVEEYWRDIRNCTAPANPFLA